MAGQVRQQNDRGEWVPAIPEPVYGAMHVRCAHPDCLRGARRAWWRGAFWSVRRYREHYALAHILAVSS